MSDLSKKFCAGVFLAATATVAASSQESFAQVGLKDSANVTMFGADTAFVLPHGNMYFGGTLSDPRGGISGSDTDADASFGIGFGNPIDSIGLQADVNITGVDPFLDSGSLTLKAARALALRPNHVVFGSLAVSNIAPWGDAKLGDERWNVTVSGMTQIDGPKLVHPVMWTVGYGSDAVLSTPGSSLTEEGLFAGVGFGVTEHFGVAVSGTENQLNAGVGFKVPGAEGLSISYGVNDITDNMERKQQMLTVSYSLTNVFGGN